MSKIETINADCMDIMKQYPNNYFDLVIADPPYGIGASKPSKKTTAVKQSNGSVLHTPTNSHKHKDWDNSTPSSDYFDELFRVSNNQIIFGVNYFKDPRLIGGRIVWDKLNGENDQMGCEIAYCSMNKRSDIVYYMWNGMMQGIYCGKDIRKALVQQGNKILNEKRIHPTQKPVKLYEWLLINYAKQGNKILDTHGGSMSSAIACHNLGFDLTIIEKDKEYFDEALKRLKWHQRQLQIF